jgi:hypothetical protein
MEELKIFCVNVVSIVLVIFCILIVGVCVVRYTKSIIISNNRYRCGLNNEVMVDLKSTIALEIIHRQSAQIQFRLFPLFVFDVLYSANNPGAKLKKI